MPGEVTLKPCPFCGGIARDPQLDNTFRSGTIMCSKCGCFFEIVSPDAPSVDAVAERWNHRAPEPGTSVIRWTRYDGTPETLPEEGEEVLFHGDEYGYEVVVLRKCPALIWTHFVYAREMREHFLTVNAGDLWSYLPEPPEGME